MTIEDMRNNFINDWNKTGVHHCKGVMKCLPDWEHIVKILNFTTRKESTQGFDMKNTTSFEVAYRDLIAVKQLLYSKENPNEFTIESEATFFFSLFFAPYDRSKFISKSLSNEIDEIEKVFNISSHFNSLKISFSKKFVPYETHTWHTCIIQVAGINRWDLKDDRQDFQKTYILEPGDMLMFKEGIYHQVSNDEPRSSVVGRFTLNSEVENA